MLKLLKKCLIPLLLIISNNLCGQTNNISSLKGIADSLVVVDVATIREATIKLLEREELKGIVSQQDTIILNQCNIIDEYKNYNLYLADENIKLTNSYNDIKKVNDDMALSIHRKNVGLWLLGGTAVTSIILNIIFITSRNGK